MKNRHFSTLEESYIAKIDRLKLKCLAKKLFGRDLKDCNNEIETNICLAKSIIVESFPFSSGDHLCPTSLDKILSRINV